MSRESLKFTWLVALGAALGACAPFVYQAEFTRRADSVRPGDLLGPYSGQAVDSGTGKPVPGALVYASWEFVRGVGFPAPAGAETWVGRTNLDGRYSVPALARLPGGLTRAVARFRLVIYKRGFVAYRSDRVFPGDLGRFDFHQLDNVAVLERWSPELSHEEHLRFVGGDGLLARATTWEVQGAVAQIEGRPTGGTTSPRPTPDEKLLDASRLLDEDDLEELTKHTGSFDVGRLTDIPRGPSYDSLHFQSTAKTQRSDAAYRVWRLPTPAAERHYAKLLAAYPNAKPDDKLGDRSFRSHNEAVLARVWLSRTPGVVVSLTCGRDLCKDATVLDKIAQLMHGRLDRLDKPAPLTPGPPLTPNVNPFRPVSPRAPVLR